MVETEEKYNDTRNLPMENVLGDFTFFIEISNIKLCLSSEDSCQSNGTKITSFYLTQKSNLSWKIKRK